MRSLEKLREFDYDRYRSVIINTKSWLNTKLVTSIGYDHVRLRLRANHNLSQPFFVMSGKNQKSSLGQRRKSTSDLIRFMTWSKANLGTVYTGELGILVSGICFYSFYSVLHGIENQRKSGHSTNRIAIGVTRLVSKGRVTRLSSILRKPLENLCVWTQGYLWPVRSRATSIKSIMTKSDGE